MTRKIFTLAFLVALVAILTGCGSYISDRGKALNNVAIARRTQAEAELATAQGEAALNEAGKAAIEGNIEVTIEALEQAETANETAIREARRGVEAWQTVAILLGGFAILALLLAMMTIRHRTPQHPPQIVTIAPSGTSVPFLVYDDNLQVVLPGDVRYRYYLQQEIARREQYMLTGG